MHFYYCHKWKNICCAVLPKSDVSLEVSAEQCTWYKDSVGPTVQVELQQPMILISFVTQLTFA